MAAQAKDNFHIKTLLCQRSSPEHQIQFMYNDSDSEIAMYIHLSPLPFFKRLWHGIKYIFGYRCKYGDFDEVLLRHSDYYKLYVLQDFLQKKQDEQTEILPRM